MVPHVLDWDFPGASGSSPIRPGGSQDRRALRRPAADPCRFGSLRPQRRRPRIPDRGQAVAARLHRRRRRLPAADPRGLRGLFAVRPCGQKVWPNAVFGYLDQARRRARCHDGRRRERPPRDPVVLSRGAGGPGFPRARMDRPGEPVRLLLGHQAGGAARHRRSRTSPDRRRRACGRSSGWCDSPTRRTHFIHEEIGHAIRERKRSGAGRSQHRPQARENTPAIRVAGSPGPPSRKLPAVPPRRCGRWPMTCFFRQLPASGLSSLAGDGPGHGFRRPAARPAGLLRSDQAYPFGVVTGPKGAGGKRTISRRRRFVSLAT